MLVAPRFRAACLLLAAAVAVLAVQPLAAAQTAKPSAHPTTSHPSFAPTAQVQCQCGDVSADDVAQVKAELRDKWVFKGPDALGDRLGAAVRLSFHDAGPALGPNSALARANGCFTLDSGENLGLDVIAAFIDNDIDRRGLSRADVWQLVGIVGLERGWEVTRVADKAMFNTSVVAQSVLDQLPLSLDIPFRVGRPDFSDGDFLACTDQEEGKLPDAQANLAGLLPIMRDRLGFSIKEIVALLGAHTLGRAEATISGFEGKWTEDADWFDNQYFIDLVDLSWQRERVPTTGLPQWGHKGGDADVMMLNADMAIAFDVEAGDTGCSASREPDPGHPILCTSGGTAETKESRSWVDFFARGADPVNGTKAHGMIEYLKVFIPTFVKMSELGFEAGELKTPCHIPAENCPIPGVTPTLSPSKSPSKAPSKSPSKAPSKSPSKTPSESPNQSPSKALSAAPSLSPTSVPTSNAPSAAPTGPPTQSPTGNDPVITVNTYSLRFANAFVDGFHGTRSYKAMLRDQLAASFGATRQSVQVLSVDRDAQSGKVLASVRVLVRFRSPVELGLHAQVKTWIDLHHGRNAIASDDITVVSLLLGEAEDFQIVSSVRP